MYQGIKNPLTVYIVSRTTHRSQVLQKQKVLFICKFPTLFVLHDQKSTSIVSVQLSLSTVNLAFIMTIGHIQGQLAQEGAVLLEVKVKEKSLRQVKSILSSL